jgi:hypothetical protein
MSIRQSDGTFDGQTIVLWATALDPDDPGRKTIAAHISRTTAACYCIVIS